MAHAIRRAGQSGGETSAALLRLAANRRRACGPRILETTSDMAPAEGKLSIAAIAGAG